MNIKLKQSILLFALPILVYCSTIILDGCNKKLAKKEKTCGIEQCHGMELSCGEKIPETCTEEYALGDYCRKFFICKSENAECKDLSEEVFSNCIACMKECESEDDPMACDTECRKQFP